MKPLKDYSFIRGVCHGPYSAGSHEELEKVLGFAKRLMINSTRFWMSEEEWKKDPEGYKAVLRDFMETCWNYGISSMPIFWNGNFIEDFQEPTDEAWALSEAYAKDIIETFGKEEYILMWDVINEPMCNDYIRHSKGGEYEKRFSELSAYVRRLCGIVRKLDPEGCLTVGHEQVRHCVSSNDLVDVISFHDYLSTRKQIEDAVCEAEAFSRQFGKPILNTETGCVGRANPYEVELEILMRHRVGWYLFNLVSEGFWGDIHGLVYPDGTIRDPAVIAALFGFFRNRTDERIRVNVNKEGHAYKAVKAVEDALRVEETTLFMSKPKTTDEILEAAEYCVNILEAAEMVPMWNPPSARLMDYRRTPEEKRDVYEIRRFAYEMAKLVRENCMFF
ncbi:MAG: cellulase family glycosylhydrolase [Lachnospiraceae bacterium]|nr:cellulase family glycosylhydrolase [Lachnospiraceae bacterium]